MARGPSAPETGPSQRRQRAQPYVRVATAPRGDQIRRRSKCARPWAPCVSNSPRASQSASAGRRRPRAIGCRAPVRAQRLMTVSRDAGATRAARRGCCHSAYGIRWRVVSRHARRSHGCARRPPSSARAVAPRNAGHGSSTVKHRAPLPSSDRRPRPARPTMVRARGNGPAALHKAPPVPPAASGASAAQRARHQLLPKPSREPTA